MLRRMFVAVVAAAIAFFCVSGCKKSPAEPEPKPGEETAKKTVSDYKDEAEKEITKENAAEELAKLEKEIEAESLEEP